MKKIIFASLVSLLSFFIAHSQTKTVVANSSLVKKTSAIRVKIITDSGIIIVRLYDSTPIHRDNFVKLVNEGYYDSLLFHRVIPNFMIQGGDPTSKYAAPRILLGNGGDSMSTIPAEFRPYLFHKRGVIAAARKSDTLNPTKASNASQFFIVVGQIFTNEQLNQMEAGMNRVFTPEERTAYTTIGGAPWLDQAYTIFGEVESGMEVVDKISKMKKDMNDKPLTDIRMKMEIIK